MAPEDRPLVSLSRVNQHFGDLHVLRDVDLGVDAGEVVVIIGPTGSGKSTLCRTVNRLGTIESGEILFDGRPLPPEGKALARLGQEVGMVFQSFTSSVTTPFSRTSRSDRRRSAASRRATRRPSPFGCSSVSASRTSAPRTPPSPGGQQQRVAIARALAMQPKVMLFDEPTSALTKAAEVTETATEITTGA